ncbi:MAG: 3-deoxy-D-manno-octulosonate cytidylyltransferase [Candidatus Omnitrophica bacterium 4484_171]|nr:MAG: 3-deoxy-D-manno-octulosonate cytidylyltransferase [Candidatus Omnitrophica bacterium 4484_171]
MEVIGVIPARLESSRLKHKLLKNILGRPLIQWTWEAAKKARLLDKLIVACDSPEIEKAVKSFSGETVITSPGHSSGTDRVAEAVRDIDVKIVINIQADEPLIHPSVIDRLAASMLEDNDIVMATVKKKIDNEDELRNTSIVKVITDKDNFAIYFSRFPIPFKRDSETESIYFKHMGIYGYTKDFLYTFKNLPFSYLEHSEKLEQLRAIESGYRIKVIETKFDFRGVDTEDDLNRVKDIISKRHNA